MVFPTGDQVHATLVREGFSQPMCLTGPKDSWPLMKQSEGAVDCQRCLGLVGFER